MGEQIGLPGVTIEKHAWPDPRQIPTSCGWNPTLRYVLVQDERALEEMVYTLRWAGTHAWDTETNGLKPELGARPVGHAFCARTAERELTGWYVPIRHIGQHNDHEPQLPVELVVDRLRPVFTDGGEVKTHHGKFDAKMARADGLELVRPIVDVSIEATIDNENEPRFGLKDLAEKYCTPVAKGEKDALDTWMRKDARGLGLSFKKHSKNVIKKLGFLNAMMTPTYMQRFGYGRTPVRLCGVYAVHDVFYTWWLSEVRYRHVRQHFRELWEREHEIALDLLEMEWHGLPANENAIRDTHERTAGAVQHWLEECKRLAPQYVGDGFTASDEELRKLFYTDLKLDPPKFTKKDKKPSADKEARKLLAKRNAEHGELFNAIDQLAVVTKLHTTYAGNYLRYYSPTTRSIHPSYNQLEQRDEGGVPVTGRMSSADPNAQNVAGETLHLWDCFCPKCLKKEAEAAAKEGRAVLKDATSIEARQMRGLPIENTVSIRRYFTVPEDWIRIYIDFSQIELRVLTWFCQDPNLLHAYLTDLDVHAMVAEQLGISRKVAKQVNFGNSYGMTEIGLALRMPGYFDDPEATREEAAKVLEAYFKKYPRILRFRAEFAAQMRRNGNMFVNPFGRPRRIPKISSSERWERERAERQMMSSIISGTSADLMKECMRRTRPIAKEVGGRLSQTIHDELVFDLPRQSGWSRTVIKLVRAMEDWPRFSQDRPDLAQYAPGRRGVPIKTNVALSTSTWEEKREIRLLDDDTFEWAEAA